MNVLTTFSVSVIAFVALNHEFLKFVAAVKGLG